MTEINLKLARISYPHLFEPFAYQGTGKAKYSAKFLLLKDDPQVKPLIAAMKELAAGTFKDKKLPPSDKLCLRDGDQTNKEEDEGHWIVAASDDRRPVVVDRGRSPLTSEDDVIYPGCYVNAKIRLWVQDNQYGKRINANLLGVQFVKEGERFGSGRKQETADEMFGDATDFDADADGDNGFGL